MAKRMKKILFINACLRGQEASRTHRLCKTYLSRYDRSYITEINLSVEPVLPLDGAAVIKRDQLFASGQINHAMFDYAKQFKGADEIVIGAPYWDLSFPAKLKTLMENICVCGITFHYTPSGPQGLCRANRLVYITTSGGTIEPYNLGYDYIKALCTGLFGIEKTECLSAQGLDITGADCEKIMREAEQKISAFA